MMRLSDLLNAAVVDSTGGPVGRVRDVRLVQDGPLLGLTQAAFRVEGIVIGGPGLAVRLGYHRRGVRGPWLLRAIAKALEQRARYVAWEDVEQWNSGEAFQLRIPASQLQSLPDPQGAP